ncbi:MAG: cupin domain-containing protein [Prevotellaceae bacterium]|nr:cupin domain-containing protein [Prevotellaceae bacterium]
MRVKKLSTVNLGSDVEKEEVAQAVIPANTWFAAEAKGKKGYALVSCTVYLQGLILEILKWKRKKI